MRETVQVRVMRIQEEEDQYGGAYQAEKEVAGSPFTCWIYRRAPSFNRQEKPQGPVTTDDPRILSFRDPEAAWGLQIGDIAVLPACIYTGNQEERVTLHHPRYYTNSVQWDIQSGATPSRADSDTRATDYPNVTD